MSLSRPKRVFLEGLTEGSRPSPRLGGILQQLPRSKEFPEKGYFFFLLAHLPYLPVGESIYSVDAMAIAFFTSKLLQTSNGD